VTGRGAAGPGRGVRWSRRLLVAAGGLVMLYAGAGALLDDDVRQVGVLLFLAGVLVAHDAVLLPLVIGAGALAGRYLPVTARTAVRVAGFVTVILLVVAIPLVLGLGRRPDDPSALPRDYGAGLAAVLILVWTAALVTALRPALRRRWAARREAAGPPA
jgi:hypothetical protein